MPRPLSVVKIIVVCCLCWATVKTWADKSAAELLPRSVLAYLEITKPAETIATVLDHPLLKQLQQSDAWKKATSAAQYKQFWQVVAVVEQRSGLQWRNALQDLAQGGAVLAIEPGSQGVVILLKPKDIATSDKLRQTLFTLVQDDAKNKGNPDPIERISYRDLTAYKAGEAILGNLGPWMVVCNRQALAQSVADRFLDGGDSLSTDQDFSAAHTLAVDGENSPSLWGFIRTEPLRHLPGPDKLLGPKVKTNNPPVELIAGGLLSTLEHTPFLAASGWITPGGIKLSLRSPHDPAWVPADRSFYFAKPGSGTAAGLLPKDALLSVSTYRDISAMWQSAPDLFTEEIATKFAQADSGISNLLAGKSFSTDVLGALNPQIQFVLTRQDYQAAGLSKPSLRLPGGALVLSVKSEQFASLKNKLRTGFQSAIALANLNSGMNGRPMLEMQSEKRGDSDIQYATYDIPADSARKPGSDDKTMNAKPGVNDYFLNFSPALVTSPKYVMLCSTKQIADDLADLSAQEDAGKIIPENTLIQIDGPRLAELIADNRETLIAKNELEKGHSKEQAEREIDLFHAVVASFERGTVRLLPTEKSIRLDVELTLSNTAR